MALSRSELLGPRHKSGNSRVMFFLTDGLPNGTYEETVLAEAETARAQGIIIYTVGKSQD